MIRRIQVYGQRCSGTNALIKLIETNFSELQFTEEFGFKHWLVPERLELPSDVMVVIIARAPEEWLRSLHANPWHAHPDLKRLEFSDFIRAPWESIWDDDFWGMSPANALYRTPIVEERCPLTGRAFDNAIAMRTAKLRNWSDLARRARACAHVSHAKLVRNPVSVLETIADLANVQHRSEWTIVDSYKGAGSKPFIPKTYPALTRADQTHVDAHLERELEDLFI